MWFLLCLLCLFSMHFLKPFFLPTSILFISAVFYVRLLVKKNLESRFLWGIFKRVFLSHYLACSTQHFLFRVFILGWFYVHASKNPFRAELSSYKITYALTWKYAECALDAETAKVLLIQSVPPTEIICQGLLKLYLENKKKTCRKLK